jgi:outer membrane protein assembly factor BamB
VAVGSKNGSFFLLDAHTMNELARRQLLPYRHNDPNQPIPTVDPPGGGAQENHSGVYGSAAVHFSLGKLYVGLGGWVDGGTGGIDSNYTPSVRAVDWNNLNDAWPTFVGGDGVTRYNIPGTPLYQTPNEVGLGSPAVVNDVVFVSTNKVKIYALHAKTGLRLWCDQAFNTPVHGITQPVHWGLGTRHLW